MLGDSRCSIEYSAGSGFYFCITYGGLRCSDRYGDLADFLCLVCNRFFAQKSRIKSAALKEKRIIRMHRILQKYYQSWNRWLYYAAYQQLGNDLLQ